MSDEHNLAAHFAAIGLPHPAAEWLLDLWAVIQVLDDAADGDKADPSQVDRAVNAIFLTMPGNDFYRQFAGALQPVLWLQVMKWRAANAAEADGMRDARSFVWRAGYYDTVLMVCHLCGIKAERAVMEMYGDDFAEYIGGA